MYHFLVVMEITVLFFICFVFCVPHPRSSTTTTQKCSSSPFFFWGSSLLELSVSQILSQLCAVWTCCTAQVPWSLFMIILGLYFISPTWDFLFPGLHDFSWAFWEGEQLWLNLGTLHIWKSVYSSLRLTDSAGNGILLGAVCPGLRMHSSHRGSCLWFPFPTPPPLSLGIWMLECPQVMLQLSLMSLLYIVVFKDFWAVLSKWCPRPFIH